VSFYHYSLNKTTRLTNTRNAATILVSRFPGGSMIRGIKFASVPTRDQEKALKFFTEKLGFHILTDQPFGNQRWIELGIATSDTNLVLFTSPGHEALIGQFQAVVFWSDDVHSTYKELAAKGVQFLQPPKTEHWGTSAALAGISAAGSVRQLWRFGGPGRSARRCSRRRW
jgi:catechol 2,3-dioxygenase-like lactoylglutathione lyase family enzyme